MSIPFGHFTGKVYLCSRFPGCSAVGSAPGLGPGGRPFESGRPDGKEGSHFSAASFCRFSASILRFVYCYINVVAQ